MNGLTLAASQSLSDASMVWIVAVFGIAAFAQALSGFGFSLLCVPLLTLVCTRTDAVVSSTMVGMVTQIWMAFKLRREVSRDIVRWALPASFVGMPVGILIGHVVNDRALRVAVGVAVLFAVVAIHQGFAVRGRPSRVDSVAGFVSGVLSTTTGTNGPPLVVALAGRSMEPGVTRATLTALFCGANIVTIALFAVDGSISSRAPVIAAIGLIPALGVRAASEGLFRKLNPARYRTLVLGLLTVAGLVAIANAIRG